MGSGILPAASLKGFSNGAPPVIHGGGSTTVPTRRQQTRESLFPRMSTSLRLPHRARSIWIALTSSLWFIPSAMVGVALVFAMTLVELSSRIDPEALARIPRLFGAGAAGSRDMLSTIAGSVITVTGVTFSITIAALALASGQYTPRVLRTFMGDRANQVVLGTFVGVYAYCLVVLRTIRGGDEGTFIPSIAVLVGFLLALVSVGVLIFFIHHIASALQASTILDRVRHATERAIDELFPEAVGDAVEDDPAATLAAQSGTDVTWTGIPARRTGYLQSVDSEGLLSFAREHRAVVRMERAVGDFVTAGLPLVSIARPGGTDGANTSLPGNIPDDVVGAANSLFTINAHRTVEQDAAFGFLQISDIALKALSPGVNDTTTAVSCVDHLGALLACVAQRRIAPAARGEDSDLRVIASGPTFPGLVSLALDDIRRNAGGNVTVLARLFDAIETTSRFARNRGRRRVLTAQVDLLTEVIGRTVAAPSDRTLLNARAQAVRSLLDDAPRT